MYSTQFVPKIQAPICVIFKFLWTFCISSDNMFIKCAFCWYLFTESGGLPHGLRISACSSPKERNDFMPICCDFHLHSSFSADSDATPKSMIEQAIRLGLDGICFTEHLDLDCPPEGPDFALDLDTYFPEIARLKQAYRVQIRIGTGIEFGMQQPHAAYFQQLVKDHPFDFVIGSVHFIDGKDPYYPSFFEGKSEEEAYANYFREMRALLDLYSDFDTLGHLDYIVRYGPNQNRFYSYARYADVIDPVLRHLISHGKCLEVNSAGLKYGLGETNPALDVLRRYRELGGELLTIGSDAHAPEHIAYDFPVVLTLLRELGFRYYTVFSERNAEMLRL